ncbi:UNVERIFIED_CONTAM: hypothetical protein GTU68_027741 [Idotea baltica]|nr:hypothetical protein [Idotea baltica]
MTPSDLIQVQTTVDCSSKAGELANQLVESRLAACVQISSPVTSVYRWDSAIQQTQEYVLVIKSTKVAWPMLQHLLAEIHPYDEPQIIALPILESSDSFAIWVNEQIDLV